MTVYVAFITRKIDPGCTMLVVNVAREIPVQLPFVPSNARVGRLGDNPLTRTVGILEHERDVIASGIPVSFE